MPFTEFDFMQKYRESFAVSELGRIYAQLPLKELAEKIRSHCKIHTIGITLNAEQASECPKRGVSPAKRVSSEKGG